MENRRQKRIADTGKMYTLYAIAMQGLADVFNENDKKCMSKRIQPKMDEAVAEALANSGYQSGIVRVRYVNPTRAYLYWNYRYPTLAARNDATVTMHVGVDKRLIAETTVRDLEMKAKRYAKWADEFQHCAEHFEEYEAKIKEVKEATWKMLDEIPEVIRPLVTFTRAY